MNAKRILLSFLAIWSLCLSYAQKLNLNEQGYYEKRGVNVLVYSNQYNGMFFDEKTAGVEIIHHGVRTVTGGAVRLQNTPEQWDLVPDVVSRTINKDGSIDVVLNYPDFNFTSSIKVFPKGNGFVIDVILDKPLPEKLVGKAGFNMEFLPSAYFEKSYIADNKPYYFPRYPSGKTMMKSSDDKIHQIFNHNTFDDRGRNEYIVPLPLATGKDIILAPEDMQRTIKLQSDSTISLYDGRNLAQNGWFVARSILPSNKTGKVLEWYVEPSSVSDWIREPNIGFSQIGYCPNQKKVSVIELDPNDNPLQDATLYKVNSNGESTVKLTADLKKWGKYLRYNYFTFDFSSIKDEGVYYIQYGKIKTNTFVISKDVFKDIWHPTLDVWFPVQMDHMEVNEAYRVWHGVPYLDDALQAPVNEKHFDGYSMGPTTDTKYKPYERIPGLNVGGWFDAGDFDIQTGSHDSALLSFTDAWENFKVDRDETFIDQKTRYVDIHRPDGKPDLLQQIEHGALNVVAQVKNIGHPVRGIVVPNLHQYHHLGDAADITDNLPYNPNLKPYESDGKSSGTMDDRWAFTNRMPMLDLQTAAALAASYRALKDYNPSLADDCLSCAKKLWEDSKDAQMSFPRFEGMPSLRHFRMDTQAAL
ncbi:MAG TPA: cellulase N-terminal Ig-like domain-containing protein, partial [Xylanibacter oryzae]|nr:cellulase N-terminal Ig-like domain-containing protein [Xylanibacter oryzae]